jgi:hypothetical protein
MNIHLLVSSPKNQIVEVRKKILNLKNGPVQDLLTECDDQHSWLSWLDPSDPALPKRWKVMVTFRPIHSKLPGYIGFSQYMISVPVCPVSMPISYNPAH